VTVSFAAVAVAQGSWPPVTVKPTVTPNRAGTARHPQGVQLKAKINWASLGAADQPIVTKFHLLFPKGAKYNGAHTPSCSRSKINLGPQACPKASIMGTGSGVAFADQTPARPKITVVNGGGKVVYFYTVLNNPARVQEPVTGTISKLSGQWAYKLHTVIPNNLQVVAGVPLVLQSLHLAGGRGDWLATTSCPSNRHWAWKALALFSNGQAIHTHGAVGCRS
jgi:hypothetical protein